MARACRPLAVNRLSKIGRSHEHGKVVPVLVVGILALVVAAPMLWWARRQRLGATSGTVAAVLGVGLLLRGGTGVGVYAWALTATDTSQLARALVWANQASAIRQPPRHRSPRPDSGRSRLDSVHGRPRRLAGTPAQCGVGRPVPTSRLLCGGPMASGRAVLRRQEPPAPADTA